MAKKPLKKTHESEISKDQSDLRDEFELLDEEETLGQMKQRHKAELRNLQSKNKLRLKQVNKKTEKSRKKEMENEMKQMESEVEQRHKGELLSIVSGEIVSFLTYRRNMTINSYSVLQKKTSSTERMEDLSISNKDESEEQERDNNTKNNIDDGFFKTIFGSVIAHE